MDPHSGTRDSRAPASVVLAGLGRVYLHECRERSAVFVRSRDPEDLHQIRVRLRRMESILRYSDFAGLFGPVTDLRRRTNDIRNVDTGVTGRYARDLQTLLGEFTDLCYQETAFREMGDAPEVGCRLTGILDYITLRKVCLRREVMGVLAARM